MFNEESNQTTEYTYDQNGNMISDANKGISSISYNVLNLPEIINFSDGNSLHYYYTADGTKVKESFSSGGSTSNREYVGGMLYIDEVLQYLPTETGRVVKSGSTYTYIHSIADHQGNIRVNFQNNNGTAELIQEDHYYPFGLTMGQSYVSGPENYNLYSSKEWKDQSSEQWYDFGFRNYDAALGRWFNPDAFAESYGAISPYNYCLNDPINMVDPLGLYPEYMGDDIYIDSESGMFISPSEFMFWLEYGHYPWDDKSEDFWMDMFKSGDATRYYNEGNGEFFGIPYTVPLPEVEIRNYRIENKIFINKLDVENAAISTFKHIFGGEVWYYGVEKGGVRHSLVRSPEGIIYEINHPSYGLEHGLTSSINGGPKAVGYKYDMNSDLDSYLFWNFGFDGGRSEISWQLVYVRDGDVSRSFFESWVYQSWEYNFFTNNCKHYIDKGLTKGGSSINFHTDLPNEWPGEYVTTWYYPY